MAPQTRCGAASIVSSSTIADIVVPFCFHVATWLYLTYRLSIAEKRERCQGGALPLDLSALPDSELWSESANSASKVEMGGGENLCERIEQGGPATFSQRTSLWSAQPFVG